MKNLYEKNEWLDITEFQKIGEILVSAGKINLIHLSMALDIQNFQKLPLGEIFISMGIISRDDLNQALTIQKTIRENINENFN